MAKVFPFRSQQRRAPGIRRRPGRRRNAPWQPLAALVGVAGALWFAAELYPNSGIQRHLNSMTGNGTSAINGSATFVLCAGAQRQNCVIDGDTIRYGGIKIRLEDIDAPEVFSPACPSEAARGRRATQRLLELINAGPFHVVRNGGRDEDRYGRKLRTIERDGVSVGDMLIAAGLARRWDGARRSWCG